MSSEREGRTSVAKSGIERTSDRLPGPKAQRGHFLVNMKDGGIRLKIEERKGPPWDHTLVATGFPD